MSDTTIVFNLEMFKNDKIVKLVKAEGYESLLKHSHSFIETVYVTEGEGKHCINGEEEKIKKGDFLIIQPGFEHYYVPKYSNSNFHIENFIFNKELFPFLNNYPCLIVRHVGDDAAIIKLIEVMEEECGNEAKNNDEIIKHLMNALLLWIIQKYSNESGKIVNYSENLCSEICEYIKNNFSEDLTLDKIAGKFYCSKNTVVSMFRKNYDTTVYHFILKVRIEKACEFLLKSDLSNREIAEKVGFQDFRNFYRYFKNVVGLTPKEYKETAGKEEIKNE